MTTISAGAPGAAPAPPDTTGDVSARAARRPFRFPALPLAAFGLYWLSSFILDVREETTHFAADTWFYAKLAEPSVLDRMGDDYELDRILRYHPTTVFLAAGWMRLAAPLTAWVPPLHLLNAMFAAIGAVGVWAALRAFAAVVPRRCAVLLGAAYAGSLSVWYFASVAESKIVAATLAALYIAGWLHLRERWTARGAVLLTAILLFACLNEAVAVFLVVIPAVDTLVRHGWDMRQGRWIACHALAGPAAVGLLEAGMRLRGGAAGLHPEGANHFSMLAHYISQNGYSVAAFYEFAVRWLFFSIAAPARFAYRETAASASDFEPVLASYLASPVSVALVALFAVMLAASVQTLYRRGRNGMAAMLLALGAYTAVRGGFFFVFVPAESLLFSSSVVLAHLLLIGAPFAASSFPFKRPLLAAAALLLFIVNGAFIIGE